MVREALAKSGGHWNGVPWRSHEVMRIEALSDAVFAFAVTLLIVSLEVPETFADLWEKMQGFVAFAISFAMLFQVWYTQHIFFRRFGLQDKATVALNGALLFLVLFYMYPLKFLFGLLVNELTGGRGLVHLRDGRTEEMLKTQAEATRMMVIYGLGFAAVFMVFVLLYLHVLRRRHDLELSAQEVYDARTSAIHCALLAGVGILSIAVLFAFGSAGLSGFVYAIIWPVLTVNGYFRGRKRRRLYEGSGVR